MTTIKQSIETIKNDVQNGYRDILNSIQYGDYFLSIIQEYHNETIIIHLEDFQGNATCQMSKEEFLKIESIEELEKHINNVLYYNYIEVDKDNY